MNKKTSLALVAGVSAMLAAAPMALGGSNLVEYIAPGAVNDPVTDEILLGLIICEFQAEKNPNGPVNPVTGDPLGEGGACYLDCEGINDCVINVNDDVVDPAAWSAHADFNKDGLTDFDCTPFKVRAKTATLDDLCKEEKLEPPFGPGGDHVKVAVFIHEGVHGFIASIDP